MIRKILALSLFTTAAPALAQHAAGARPSLAGVWRGTSLCTAAGRPACHDETVVYHVTQPRTDSIVILMNKVVAGQEEEMATLGCAADRARATVVCPMRDWRWSFAVGRDSLIGTLANPTGVVWRHIRVGTAAPD